jgi:hypothetical protein
VAETMSRGAIAALPVALETHPMEARLVDELPREPGWRGLIELTCVSRLRSGRWRAIFLRSSTNCFIAACLDSSSGERKIDEG